MGLAGSNSRNPHGTLKIWWNDPVRPLDPTYSKMAEKVMEEVNVAGVVNTRQPASPVVAKEPVKQNARVYILSLSELGRRERFCVFASLTQKHFEDAKREDVPPLKTTQSRKT